MKRIMFILLTIAISYLINSYAYATFDITKVPTDAKYASAFTCLVICGIVWVVESEMIKELTNKK
jgi:hypothetical protein